MSQMRQQVGHQAQYQIAIDSQLGPLSEATQTETTLGGLEEPFDPPASLAPANDVTRMHGLRREHEAPLPLTVAFEPIGGHVDRCLLKPFKPHSLASALASAAHPIQPRSIGQTTVFAHSDHRMMPQLAHSCEKLRAAKGRVGQYHHLMTGSESPRQATKQLEGQRAGRGA